jgi:hypothetical protein
VLEERFAQFNKYLEQEMKTPLDFFKVLKWAREPSIAELRTKSLWANVWEELYLLAVAHGRRMALSPAWNHLPTMDATVQLKAIAKKELKVVPTTELKATQAKERRFDPTATFVAGSKDWGFHPKDAELIYLPFIDRAAEAAGRRPNPKLVLLRARILMHHLNVDNFQKAQQLRRAATIYAKFRNLNLMDEIEATVLSREARDTDPLEAANRIWQTTGPAKYRINEGEKDCFSVVWIDPGSIYVGRRAPSVYVELYPYPGQIFQTFGRGALAPLAEDLKFRLVAESLTALGNFMLVYLVILGFVIDIITAGAASTTLRGLLYNFIKEKLIEAAVDKGLDVLKIDSLPLRFLVQAGVGMKTAGAGRKLKSAEEFEREAAHVTFGKPKPAKPDVAAPRGYVRGGVGATDHFGTFDPGAVRIVTAEMREKISKAARLQYAEEEDVIDELVEKAIEKTKELQELLDVRMTAPAGHGTGMSLFHVAGAPTGKGAGKAGASPKALTKSSKKATKFTNSPAYQTLDLYEDFVPPLEWKKLVNARDQVRKRLQTDAKYPIKQANKELKTLINKAKELSGEEMSLVDVFSRFEVDYHLTIPIRGKKGPPMLDVGVRLKKGQPYLFVLVEAKGGKDTGLGKVTRKQYSYAGKTLVEVDMPSGGFVRQATGEWYYQKFAEIYLAGQGSNPPGQAAMDLALELIEAAKQGKIRFEVIKHSTDIAKDIDDTASVTAWFSQKLTRVPKGTLPIPVVVAP